MTRENLIARFRSVVATPLPLPGHGETPLRHRRLMEVGREDLSLARLAEAHWDAIAILAEAGRQPQPGLLYGVWASEIPGQGLELQTENHTINGSKMFCSGAGIIDRALVTVGALLIDIDLHQDTIQFDDSAWETNAFAETRTAKATFSSTHISTNDIIGEPGWYLTRPGFWHGACGPAACWAGGAAGLLDYALQQSRNDPHTLAHLGAMHASIWALQSYLDTAGREIDEDPTNTHPNSLVISTKAQRSGEIAAFPQSPAAHIRALTVRHLVEQACTDILRRLPRAYGPHPLAMNEEISRRYQELDLYLRQSHAERDLEALGTALKS